MQGSLHFKLPFRRAIASLDLFKCASFDAILPLVILGSHRAYLFWTKTARWILRIPTTVWLRGGEDHVSADVVRCLGGRGTVDVPYRIGMAGCWYRSR